MENIDKNQEKTLKKVKKQKFLRKINPYREIFRNPDDGYILDSNSYLYYREFVQWIVEVLLNGIFLWFILFVAGKQPLHWVPILGDGIFVWFVSAALKKVWNEITEGIIKIKRG
jgi:hypothetical protein